MKEKDKKLLDIEQKVDNMKTTGNYTEKTLTEIEDMIDSWK